MWTVSDDVIYGIGWSLTDVIRCKGQNALMECKISRVLRISDSSIMIHVVMHFLNRQGVNDQ